jgi:hypothetical protein
MTPKTKNLAYGITKIAELALLGYGTYYAATKGQAAEPLVFVVIYALLIALALADYLFMRLRPHNMHLLLKYFYEQCEFDKQDDVRITIHRKLNKDTYEQYVDYIPLGSKRGRRHPVRKGIVRKAFTTTQGEFTENFSSPQEKLDKLKMEYNYTHDEAREKVNDGEVSYYCCPIMDDGRVWGVLYMNSKTHGTFPSESLVKTTDFSRRVRTLVKLLENEISQT